MGGLLYLGASSFCFLLTRLFLVGGEPSPLFDKFIVSVCSFAYPFSSVLFVMSVFVGMGIHFLISEKLFKKSKTN